VHCCQVVLLRSRGVGLRSALLRPDAAADAAAEDGGKSGGCRSGSLLADDVGDTITERPVPAREPPDSGLSPVSRDDLPGRALCDDDDDDLVLSERPVARWSSVISCGSREAAAAE